MLRPLVLIAALAAAPAAAQVLEVAKTPTCGCCDAWVRHMAEAGFDVLPRNLDSSALNRLKIAAGIVPETASCHTAMVEGYVVEGHVPAEDVRRLLAERPDAVGIAVPGMPIGSPGMEMGDETEPYEVLLIRRDGATETFARR